MVGIVLAGVGVSSKVGGTSGQGGCAGPMGTKAVTRTLLIFLWQNEDCSLQAFIDVPVLCVDVHPLGSVLSVFTCNIL